MCNVCGMCVYSSAIIVLCVQYMWCVCVYAVFALCVQCICCEFGVCGWKVNILGVWAGRLHTATKTGENQRKKKQELWVETVGHWPV